MLTYEEIFEIIKAHGPISIDEIGAILIAQGKFTKADFTMAYHSNVAGYIGALSRNNLIEKIEYEVFVKNTIRKSKAICNYWKVK